MNVSVLPFHNGCKMSHKKSYLQESVTDNSLIMPLQLQEQLILINFTIYLYFTEAFWIYKTPDISLFLHACSMPECNYHRTIFCNIGLYFELNHEMKLKISILSLFCVNFKTRHFFSNKITCHLHPIRQ